LSHTVPVLPLLIDDSRDLVHTDLDALFLDYLTTSVEKKIPQWLDGMEVLDVGEDGDEDLWKEGATCYALHDHLKLKILYRHRRRAHTMVFVLSASSGEQAATN
jgi:hypothetical protein